MLIFPAIDIIDGKAVRLLRGDYDKKTIYHNDPLIVARDFEKCGAAWIHLVDLDGAKSGDTPNLDTVKRIAENTSLHIEVGGGIRNMETVKRYLENGVDRVILGTAAVRDPEFLKQAISIYGEQIAVGIDLKDGFVAIKGWTEVSELDADTFFLKMQRLGVKTVICTDISRDGAMQGTNRELYRSLSEKYQMDLIASGGVSNLEDVKALRAMGLYGAIVGKAYYTGAIDLAQAIEVAK